MGYYHHLYAPSRELAERWTVARFIAGLQELDSRTARAGVDCRQANATLWRVVVIPGAPAPIATAYRHAA